MTIVIVILFGFLVPLVAGTLAVARLRRRFGGRSPAILWDAAAVALGAVLIMIYFALVALAGGVAEPRDFATFASYAIRMTVLTLPFWGGMGLVLPRISVSRSHR